MSLSFSGIYPHLAVCNEGYAEVGIGAVVPWAGRLWYLTYPPHLPYGSNDKLYALDANLEATIHPASIGGTHANRMIHSQSNQLIIGPYFIDSLGHVRTISPKDMPGRLTAVARHLTDPENKVYIYTMEQGLYEVDVHRLQVTILHTDLNVQAKKTHAGDGAGAEAEVGKLLRGTHGKGAYTGQGRLVVSNNGTGGVLAEWDGLSRADHTSSWNVIDPNKYTDITGPGGICGSSDQDSPLWAVGWDHKSVLLNVCDKGSWTRYRLPKGSYTHEADHGWFTEWPRIREVGEGPLLMDMFGMFFEFPRTFSIDTAAGIRPIANHHKMVVDFTEWHGGIVMACNDASLFDNRLLGRPQSNLWFGSLEQIREFGKPAGWGGPWVRENIQAQQSSEPFLLAGFEHRILHLYHDKGEPVTFALEIDARGEGNWTAYASIDVPAEGYAYHIIPSEITGEWIRMHANCDIPSATAYFFCASSIPNHKDEQLFTSIPETDRAVARSEGVIRARNDDNLSLEFAANILDKSGNVVHTGYYQIAGDMKLERITDPQLELQLRDEAATVKDFDVDQASVIMTDHQGYRYRLPKGLEIFDEPTASGWPRGIREVVTERNVMNIHGTFYELPRPLSGGLANIQPICTHNRRIYDYTSWRGMLVISGNVTDMASSGNYVSTDDNRAGLWFGHVDDLYKLGAPCGIGGPWATDKVAKNVPSDPYLMLGYNKKRVELSHDLHEEVVFTIEVQVIAGGAWGVYDTIAVTHGMTVHTFPHGFTAHWVRVTANKDCKATAQFIYE